MGKKFSIFNFQFSISRGQMLIELVLAIGISVIIIPALLTGLYASDKTQPQHYQSEQATALMQQTVAAVEDIKDSDWSSFATNGTYHPEIVNNKWTLATNAQTANGFTQQVVISDVYRDSNDAIVTSGGTLDPSTKQVTITVSWTKPTSSSLTSTLYFARTTNLTYTQTTASDFEAGTLNDTTVTDTDGGEVELGAGNANWCRPQNYIVDEDTLPKLSNAIYGVTGHAYLGSGDGSSNSPMFINVGISTPAPPATPAATITGTFNGSYVTNAIYSDGNYVYLATTNPTAQVVILNITASPYTQVGTINLSNDFSDSNPANDVYVSGNTLYVTSGDYLYSYDITNPGSPAKLGSVKMGGSFWTSGTPEAEKVIVANNIAYVTTANTWLGLQVYSISNGGAKFSLKGFSEITWNQAGVGLSVNSSATRAYVAFNNGNCGGSCGNWFKQGFYIVDIADPQCWPFWWWCAVDYYPTVGSYNAGNTDPTGMTIVPGGNRAIIVGTGGTEQYQVVDISNETDPTLCGYMSIPSGVYGVTSVLDSYENAYSYITTGESGNQFKIIQGGNGGNYSESGTFESSTFDATIPSAFNRFQATIAQPSATTVQMQVASANAVNGSCTNASYTYVGPGGSTSSYFTPVGASISAQIPFSDYNPDYANPGQCFRYKVWMTTSDTSQTPVFYDMTVNYSQ
jgi:LVIVD repeat